MDRIKLLHERLQELKVQDPETLNTISQATLDIRIMAIEDEIIKLGGELPKEWNILLKGDNNV